ncbi:alpha/beta hydrolase [Acidothermaceae bacterium B102]|nr:alpha/beta hydrolase [Acidothermaceae bacterium B102]
MTEDIFHDVDDRSAVMPDGRTVAWTAWGSPTGTPLLRIPGTPGSRYSVRADRAPWRDRGLFVLTTERPGFGASTRLPGRRFSEHADDLARLLDVEGVERTFVTGGSGAGPHILSFLSRHPDRVRAATVTAGAAPLREQDVEQMIELNQQSYRLSRARDVEGLLALLRANMSDDPLADIRSAMATAPHDDLAIMDDPAWQQAFARAQRQALGGGPEGWLDECLALDNDWDEIDLSAVTPSLTWWHTRADRNTPFESARALVDQLPNARLNVWAEGGHLAAYRREGEVLDELLSRG